MAFLRFLCITLVCALWLTECSPGRRGPKDLEFWTLQLSPTFDDYIRGVIHEFEQSHPGVRVHWVDVPFEGITPVDSYLLQEAQEALAPLVPLV